jgi:NADPH-dependent stearoyl-CoA 9-desaturase
MQVSTHTAAAAPGRVLGFASDSERIASFGRALDALRLEVETSLGDVDVAYLRRVRSLSQRLELLGRGLIHFSFEPCAWSIGVATLSAHKLLELIEIGHTVLHGTYDDMNVEPAYHGRNFRWRAPIEEGSWRTGHNLRHHQFTNIAGRDPDLDFAVLRLGAGIPFRRVHRLQPFSNALTWLAFSNAINLHVSGLLAQYFGRGEGRKKARVGVKRAALAKLARYYGREYVLFPALAGPHFAKVLAANIASELVRDVYAGATIYCGHIGATEYPPGSHAKGRAEWYVMQVEGSRDFEVRGFVAILCGGLERQIEHHLFPRLPPNRLRQIAPRVRAICVQHGVRYRSGTWSQVLGDVYRRLSQLASRDGCGVAMLDTSR